MAFAAEFRWVSWLEHWLLLDWGQLPHHSIGYEDELHHHFRMWPNCCSWQKTLPRRSFGSQLWSWIHLPHRSLWLNVNTFDIVEYFGNKLIWPLFYLVALRLFVNNLGSTLIPSITIKTSPIFTRALRSLAADVGDAPFKPFLTSPCNQPLHNVSHSIVCGVIDYDLPLCQEQGLFCRIFPVRVLIAYGCLFFLPLELNPAWRLNDCKALKDISM